MKSFFYTIVAATTFLCSCTTNDDPVADYPSDNPSIVSPSSFTASIDEAPSIDEVGSRVWITLDGYAVWENGDKVSINGKTYVTSTNGKQVEFVGDGALMVDGKYRVYFPASIYKDPYHAVLPAEYKYTKEHYDMPMYAESDSTTLRFKNLCSILTVKVSHLDMDSISSITLFSDKQMNGEFTVDLNDQNNEFLKFTEAPTWENKHVTIKCDTIETLRKGESRVFHFPIPTQKDATLWVVVTGPNATKIMKTKNNAVTIKRSKYYSFEFGTKNSQTSCMPGEFSVSPTKKVHFAKSNLYWNGTPSDGKFYHFENNPTNHPSTRYYNHIGFFYWSKYADFACMPSKYFDPNRTIDDKIFCDEEHKMTVDEEDGFYALSGEEWEYMIGVTDEDKYVAPHSKLKFDVKVGNQEHCMVIAPDGFAGDLENEYTLDDANALSLICLPPTTLFDGDYMWFSDIPFGYYWLADACNTDEGKVLYIDHWKACHKNLSRYMGCALRLVK